MGKVSHAYADNSGRLHTTPDQATVADLTAVVGNAVLAKSVLENRDEIERILHEHDMMLDPHEDRSRVLAPTVSLQAARPLMEAVLEILDNRAHEYVAQDDRDMLIGAYNQLADPLGFDPFPAV